MDAIRLLSSILPAHITVVGACWKVAVFQQRYRTFDVSGAEVDRKHRGDLVLFGPFHKFICADFIRLDALPCQIDLARTVFHRPYAVSPVIV